jgi:hypothetical protein
MVVWMGLTCRTGLIVTGRCGGQGFFNDGGGFRKLGSDELKARRTDSVVAVLPGCLNGRVCDQDFGAIAGLDQRPCHWRLGKLRWPLMISACNVNFFGIVFVCRHHIANQTGFRAAL